MKLCRLVFARSTAILLLCLSVVVVSGLPMGCNSTAGPGGTGGSTGTGGRIGTGGSTGSGTGTGGSSATDAGSDVRAGGTGGRAATDAGSGAGGNIVMVDAAGNTFTCADLLACCNRVTDVQGKALCLQQYNTRLPMGDSSCGLLLVQIRANGGCP